MKSAFLVSKGLLCLYDKHNNTWLLVDMEFLFSCSTRHLTRSLRSLVSDRVKHSKRNSISTRAHVLFSIYHINYGVSHGFPALRKAVTTLVKKYGVFDIANQLLTRHSPFAPLGQVDEWWMIYSFFESYALFGNKNENIKYTNCLTSTHTAKK